MKLFKAPKLSVITESFLSNSPVYSLLALYMPMAMLTAFVFIFREFLNEILPQPFPWIFPIISGGLSGIAASFYFDLMKDDKSSRTAANMRGIIIVMSLSYILASIFSFRRENYMWLGLFPGIANVTAAVAALYAWESVLSMKQLFKARKQFDEYTELYHDEKLHEALFGDAALLQYTDEEIVTTRRNYILQLLLIGILLLLNTISKKPLSPGLVILIFCVLESGIIMVGFLGLFRKEQYYAGEGLVFPPFDRFKCMIGTGVFSALCIAFAIIFSSDKNLLSITPVIEFFRWLFGLLRRTPQPSVEMTLPEIEPPSLMMEMETPFFDMAGEPGKPLQIWKWLKYAAIILAAAWFVWFMISPLFKRGKNSHLTVSQRLRRIITEWFKGVLNAILDLFALIRNDKSRNQLQKPTSAEIRRAADALFGAYSRAKRRDIKQSITLFARLIIWGAKARQVTWKPSHAPGEYCYLLTASAPSVSTDATAAEEKSLLLRQNEAIIRCGQLFEQALYSAEVLSSEDRREFKELVEEITGS